MFLAQLLKMNLPFRLILGSESPRRIEILSQAGIPFESHPANIREDYPDNIDPREVPLYLANMKNRALDSYVDSNTVVLTADTVVLLNNQILGKPNDREDAFRMLNLLSGQKHEVITGIVMRSDNRQIEFSETTEVIFENLSKSDIETYLDHFQPLDKAGAYGIQDWIGFIGISKISGSYYNVVGLPISRVYRELKQIISERAH